MLRDLHVGWSEFIARRWVWIITAQGCLKNAAFIASIAVLGHVIADARLGRATWGLALASMTIGLVAGGVLALRWHPRRALTAGVLLSGATALPILALAVTPSIPVLLPAFFTAGVAVEQFGVAWDQALQTRVSAPDRLARVYSYDALGSFAAIPIGEALIGPISSALGTTSALIACALTIILATGAALTDRSVRAS